MPHTVPNSPMNGVTAPVVASHGQPALQPREFFRRCDLGGALQRRHTNGIRRLFAQLTVGALEDGDQRAGLELLRHGSDVLQPLRLAKRAHEAVALHPRPPEQSPLGENDGPRSQR